MFYSILCLLLAAMFGDGTPADTTEFVVGNGLDTSFGVVLTDEVLLLKNYKIKHG